MTFEKKYDENGRLFLQFTPTDQCEIVAFMEVLRDLRPNKKGILPVVVIDTIDCGCDKLVLRVRQSFDGSGGTICGGSGDCECVPSELISGDSGNILTTGTDEKLFVPESSSEVVPADLISEDTPNVITLGKDEKLKVSTPDLISPKNNVITTDTDNGRLLIEPQNLISSDPDNYIEVGKDKKLKVGLEELFDFMTDIKSMQIYNPDDLKYFSVLAYNDGLLYSMVTDPNQARILNAATVFQDITSRTTSVIFEFSKKMNTTIDTVLLRSLLVGTPDVIIGNWSIDGTKFTVNFPTSGDNILIKDKKYQFDFSSFRTSDNYTMADGDRFQTFVVSQESYMALTDNRVIYFENNSTPISAFYNTSSQISVNGLTYNKDVIKEIVFGISYKNVMILEDYFLYGFQSLTSLDISSFLNLNSIKSYFIYNCTSLKFINIGSKDFSNVYIYGSPDPLLQNNSSCIIKTDKFIFGKIFKNRMNQAFNNKMSEWTIVSPTSIHKIGTYTTNQWNTLASTTTPANYVLKNLEDTSTEVSVSYTNISPSSTTMPVCNETAGVNKVVMLNAAYDAVAPRYFHASLTENSRDSFFDEISIVAQMNTGAANNGVIIFSNKINFDIADATIAMNISFGVTTAVGCPAPVILSGAQIPAGTKSFGIYRNFTLGGTNFGNSTSKSVISVEMKVIQ